MKKHIAISILFIVILVWIMPQTNAHHSANPIKYVALTFDDGPNETNTPLLLDILKSGHIHATFFMIGKNAAVMPEIVRRVYDEWNMIGNHTWDHTKLTTLSNEEIFIELQKAQNIIHKITWYTPILFRPPYGAQNRRIINLSHLASVQWSLDSNDWELPSTGELVQNIMNNVVPWAIILMHDTLTWTIQAMPQLIDALQKSGYTMVTVGKLLWGYKHIHQGRIYRK